MSEFSEGEVIAGRYEVRRLLGRGGMGVVYLVLDAKTNRPRALKTLLEEYSLHKRSVRRFAREVNAVRQLNHPGIVRIYDAGKVDDFLYYTMEYIEGESLRHWIIRRRRFSIGQTVRVLSLLCGALEHAHRVTIHRDVSPENIMITGDGNVKLLDFGLAKLSGSDAFMTRVGESLGKLQYCAPEQHADARNADHRCDLFAVGIMFFEMLAGKRPAPGETLVQLRPELPSECEMLYRKATAHNPEDRVANATELREALMRVYRITKKKQADDAQQAGQPRSAVPPPPLPAHPPPDSGAEGPTGLGRNRFTRFFRRLFSRSAASRRGTS